MNSKLFVRNLSWSVSESELYTLFQEAGDVTSVSIPTRREDGKPRGFAFIEMGSQDAAQNAIRILNGQMLSGRDLVVDFQDENRGSGSSRPNNTAQANSKLFVRNVAYSVSEDDLQALFQQAGVVVSIRIPSDRDTGEPKGFAFIEMSSVEEAQHTIQQFNGYYLQGKELAIDFQDPNRSRSKPQQNRGYSRSGGGYNQNRGSGYANW